MSSICVIANPANFMFAPKYMLSSGKGYGKYGLALTASTMCALQGFWNFIVYAHPRNYLTRKSMSRMASGANALFKSFTRRMSIKAGKEKNEIRMLNQSLPFIQKLTNPHPSR